MLHIQPTLIIPAICAELTRSTGPSGFVARRHGIVVEPHAIARFKAPATPN